MLRAGKLFSQDLQPEMFITCAIVYSDLLALYIYACEMSSPDEDKQMEASSAEDLQKLAPHLPLGYFHLVYDLTYSCIDFWSDKDIHDEGRQIFDITAGFCYSHNQPISLNRGQVIKIFFERIDRGASVEGYEWYVDR